MFYETHSAIYYIILGKYTSLVRLEQNVLLKSLKRMSQKQAIIIIGQFLSELTVHTCLDFNI